MNFLQGASEIAIIGLSSTFIVGLITWILSKISSNSYHKKLESLFQARQKDKEEIIKSNYDELERSAIQLKKREYLADQKRKSINNLADQANNNLSKIMKETNIEKIDDYLNDEWDRL